MGKREIRPWDVFNKNVIKASEEISQKRLSICMVCPEFIKLTAQCKQCGCLMKAKTKVANSECPLGKWHKASVSFEQKE